MVAISVAAALVVIAFASAAMAAQWNDIHGNVYQGGAWYVSTNDRHVTTPNDTVKQYTTNLPFSGLKMYLQYSSGGAFGSQQSWTSNNTQRTLASGVSNGVVFNTVTAQISAGGDDNYWEGQIYY